MPAGPGAAKVVSFRLQDGRSKEEAAAALGKVAEHFWSAPETASFLVLHDPESGTYQAINLFTTADAAERIGKAMVASGVADALFAIIDPSTYEEKDLESLSL